MTVYTIFEPYDMFSPTHPPSMVGHGHGLAPIPGYTKVEVVAVDALLSDEALEAASCAFAESYYDVPDPLPYPSERKAIRAALRAAVAAAVTREQA